MAAMALQMVRLLSILLLLAVSAKAGPPPSCTSVAQMLNPCLDFLKAGGRYKVLSDDVHPSKSCCSGVKVVRNSVKNTEDVVGICECIKEGLSKAGSYDPSRIPLLPQKCNVLVNLPPIDKNFNCSK